MTSTNLDLDVAINTDLSTLGKDEVLDVAEALHRAAKQRRALSDLSSSSSENEWIRADTDSPFDESPYGNHDGIVLAFYRPRNRVILKKRSDFKDHQPVIYFRLPRRFVSRIHVFKQNCAITGGRTRRFWVSIDRRPPRGFVPFSTISLSKLGWRVRAKICLGRIEWLYIPLELEVDANTTDEDIPEFLADDSSICASSLEDRNHE